MSAVRREASPRVGLCATCRHHRAILSGRGSRFHLCELSKTHRSYPRYPVLPVLSCEGHLPQEGHSIG